MAIEEELLNVVLAIIALGLTYATYWLRKQRNEAWTWGDNFIKAANEKMKLIVALADLYPPVKPVVEKAQKLMIDIEAAWNDNETTVAELEQYMDDMMALYDEALKLVEKYTKR